MTGDNTQSSGAGILVATRDFTGRQPPYYLAECFPSQPQILEGGPFLEIAARAMNGYEDYEGDKGIRKVTIERASGDQLIEDSLHNLPRNRSRQASSPA